MASTKKRSEPAPTGLRFACAVGLLMLFLLALPAVVQAQFTYTTNNGTITITGYTGPGGAVTIPSMTNGLPVTSIGDAAFVYCASVTSVTIPNGVTSIGVETFYFCTSLTSVTIPDSITSIGAEAFEYSGLTNVIIPGSVTSIGYAVFYACTSLTSATIPNSVTSIGDYAFEDCPALTSVVIPEIVTSIGTEAFKYTGLTNVIIPGSVTSIGSEAFAFCYYLQGAYFQGNAPGVSSDCFSNDSLTVYYLPGITGWDATFAGFPTAPWMLPYPLILNSSPDFGVKAGGFSFIISWATNVPVAVEACTNLSNPVWQPVQTNTLTGGYFYFSDPTWTNYPGRFYRVRSP
jgi:hypothetical protein